MSLIAFGIAASNLTWAYESAALEANTDTVKAVEKIDLAEFENYYGLSLSEEDETLVRLALLAYCDRPPLSLPVGMTRQVKRGTETNTTYIGNLKTKKFHYDSCDAVKDMKESNKTVFDSREEAIDAGFKPCGRCQP